MYFICSLSSKSAQKYHLGRKLCSAWKQPVLTPTEKYLMENYKFHNNFEPILVGYLKFHHLQALRKLVFRPRQPHLQVLQPRNQNPSRCRSLIRQRIPDYEHLKLYFKNIKLSKLWYFKFAFFTIKYGFQAIILSKSYLALKIKITWFVIVAVNLTEVFKIVVTVEFNTSLSELNISQKSSATFKIKLAKSGRVWMSIFPVSLLGSPEG